MLYSLVAYFVIRYHVPKMARAALLSCDHHGGKKAGIILWLPGETTSETTSFGLLFITNTAIFTKISSRPISNPIKTRCFVPDNRILYWLPTRWSCWEIFFHNQSFLDCRVLQSGIGEHGISLDNMKDKEIEYAFYTWNCQKNITRIAKAALITSYLERWV